MGARIDLNADLGESFGAYSMGADAEVLAFVTSANVACGFHAGDPSVIDRTVAGAVRAGVAVGAHPGHWDLRGFGRRVIAVDPEEVVADIVYQVGALAAFAASHGTRLTHVKPHGALYNQAVMDERLAAAVARGVARAGRGLILVGLASSAIMRRAAEAEGLRFAAEAFADRAYERDGTLRSRSLRGAVMTDAQTVAAQAVRIAREGVVTAADGTEVRLQADTLCLHGDTPNAVALARAVRGALEAAGVAVRALDR
ncbi:MAG TPA: 5-oxoprolinase subunit PxpA [Vicinamibacteria bacterium]|nr:5-oxoprolinase subunit PxpA [Vicinamibacteria bacterium]